MLTDSTKTSISNLTTSRRLTQSAWTLTSSTMLRTPKGKSKLTWLPSLKVTLLTAGVSHINARLRLLLSWLKWKKSISRTTYAKMFLGFSAAKKTTKENSGRLVLVRITANTLQATSTKTTTWSPLTELTSSKEMVRPSLKLLVDPSITVPALANATMETMSSKTQLWVETPGTEESSNWINTDSSALRPLNTASAEKPFRTHTASILPRGLLKMRLKFPTD